MPRTEHFLNSGLNQLVACNIDISGGHTFLPKRWHRTLLGSNYSAEITDPCVEKKTGTVSCVAELQLCSVPLK